MSLIISVYPLKTVWRSCSVFTDKKSKVIQIDSTQAGYIQGYRNQMEEEPQVNVNERPSSLPIKDGVL